MSLQAKRAEERMNQIIKIWPINTKYIIELQWDRKHGFLWTKQSSPRIMNVPDLASHDMGSHERLRSIDLTKMWWTVAQNNKNWMDFKPKYSSLFINPECFAQNRNNAYSWNTSLVDIIRECNSKGEFRFIIPWLEPDLKRHRRKSYRTIPYSKYANFPFKQDHLKSLIKLLHSSSKSSWFLN